MSFCIHDSDIFLCNNEKIIVYNIRNNSETVIHLPELQIGKRMNVHNNLNIETFHTITNISCSNDGNYFFVCTNRKQLCLYERKSQKFVLNKILPRAASKVKFTPTNDMVVADKAGDVYLFSNKEADNGILLLGHLSMLLDVLITEDEKYIITTDRDEKIRVSMFPNSYNIVCYCLGHKKFVTNVLELPHDKSILMSCGGDGKLMLWDYKIGKELLFVDFSDKISKNDIEEFNQQFQDCHLEETIEILPAKHLRLLAISETSSLAVISLYSSPLLLVYIVNGTMSNIEVHYLQSLVTDSEPLECYLYKQNLWLLNDLGFKVYEFKDSNFVPGNEMDYKINQLNNFWKILKKDTIQQNLFSILYKRKYDNVQEYLQRKKTRLGSISE